MLDIGKLILCAVQVVMETCFSSMLDIGKLIHSSKYSRARFRFSSMLDIDKLIRKYPIGYWLDSGGDA